MATITFKGKVQTMYTMDDEVAYEFVKVPKLTRKHCNMAAFRMHKRWGGFANSNMFESILGRIKGETFTNGELRLHEIPEGVSIDLSGFLAKITLEV